MELINNIWIALSTPNELNTFLFTFPLVFIEAYLFMSFFLVILGITHLENKNYYIQLSQ